MRTIGRRYSGKRRNYADVCDYCDVRWHRDELRLDASGRLACPDEQDGGRTEMELQLLMAENAGNVSPIGDKRR